MTACFERLVVFALAFFVSISIAAAQAPRANVPQVQAPRVQAPRVQAPRVQAPKMQAPKAQATVPAVQPKALKFTPPKSPSGSAAASASSPLHPSATNSSASHSASSPTGVAKVDSVTGAAATTKGLTQPSASSLGGKPGGGGKAGKSESPVGISIMTPQKAPASTAVPNTSGSPQALSGGMAIKAASTGAGSPSRAAKTASAGGNNGNDPNYKDWNYIRGGPGGMFIVGTYTHDKQGNPTQVNWDPGYKPKGNEVFVREASDVWHGNSGYAGGGSNAGTGGTRMI